MIHHFEGPDAFRAYAQNIGGLTPMMYSRISAALQDFTDEQITNAIEVAVVHEKRSWAYVAAILRRWDRDGFPDRPIPPISEKVERRSVSAEALSKYIDQKRRETYSS